MVRHEWIRPGVAVGVAVVGGWAFWRWAEAVFFSFETNLGRFIGEVAAVLFLVTVAVGGISVLAAVAGRPRRRKRWMRGLVILGVVTGFCVGLAHLVDWLAHNPTVLGVLIVGVLIGGYATRPTRGSYSDDIARMTGSEPWEGSWRSKPPTAKQIKYRRDLKAGRRLGRR